MNAYILSNITIKDHEKFKEYIQHVPGTLADFGGKLIVASQGMEVVEGTWDNGSFIALEFPSMEKAKEWYYSEQHSYYKSIRKASANSTIAFVDGLLEN